MRNRILAAVCLLLALPAAAQWNYPASRKDNTVTEYFGTRVSDPYRWLEDDRSAETKNWVTEQNRVTFAFLNNITYRENWLKRIKEINDYPKITTPFKRGDYFYFYRNDGLQNQSVLYRRKKMNEAPEKVIDPNGFSADGTTAMVGFAVSANGHYAAVTKSRGGSDWRTIRVFNLQTLQFTPDSIEWVKFSSPSWKGNGFYYTRYPQPEKGKELTARNENAQIFYHQLGTPQDRDVLVYEDKNNPTRSLNGFTTEDEKYLMLFISDRGKGKSGNAYWYADLSGSDKSFKPIIAEPGNDEYAFVDEHGGKFLFRTNNAAPNYKLVSFQPGKPEAEAWQTIIPEKPEPLTSAGSAGGKLFVSYTKDVLSHYAVCDFNGRVEREVKPPVLGLVSGFNGQRTDKFVFYTLSSMVMPPVTYQYDIATGKSTLFMKTEIKYNPDDFIMEQRFYTSKDGTRVPLFITYKKGLKRDGKNPTILYGYGGFNIASTPNFSATRIAWLEQGGVYCIANLRGGSEYGEKWHRAGMLQNKQNVFDDFIAAGEFLAKEKYTSPDYLALQGGSNGGLLVGAVINQRPDICRVAIPQVGVMDMLRYHKFTIGSAWINEYGSSDNEADFKNIYRFSPLHNIRADIPYPAVLVTTADHDDRVVPGHSFKYMATLQENYKGANPVMIRVDVNSGHGASNSTKGYELTADIYSFIFYNMQKTPVF